MGLFLLATGLFLLIITGLAGGAWAYRVRSRRLDALAIESHTAAPRELTDSQRWDQVWDDSDAAFWRKHGLFAGRDFAREDRADAAALYRWRVGADATGRRLVDAAFDRIARCAVNPDSRPHRSWRLLLRWRGQRFTDFTDLYSWHLLDRARVMGGWDTTAWTPADDLALLDLLKNSPEGVKI